MQPSSCYVLEKIFAAKSLTLAILPSLGSLLTSTATFLEGFAPPALGAVMSKVLMPSSMLASTPRRLARGATVVLYVRGRLL